MSDQPKPASGEGTPEQLRKWDAITREPKLVAPSSEWTVEKIISFINPAASDYSWAKTLTKAINAALAAERENRDIDWQLVVGALDSLGVALADHDHQWTEGERAIYEKAVEIASNE